MNSEELELSLRTEFESHLKSVVADMRQEFSGFQEKIEAEFDKHKTQLDQVFQEFSARLGNEKELEVGFSETVVEHLRLARDEGARITAVAFGEAEEMQKQTAADAEPKVGIGELSAAINDITAQTSQATILKELVHHAAQFTPRGAFFIIKNEHFVGWRVFGKEGDSDEQAVREVFFPVASSTTLGESVRSLGAVESSFGTHSDDSIYLNKLEFGQPERMYAIPLVARGRGVAVLYADYGTQGEEVNFEALDTIVRVAGLTVEVLAGAPAARTVQDSPAISESYEETVLDETHEEEKTVSGETYEEYVEPEVVEEYQAVTDEEPAEVEASESNDFSAQPVSVSEDSVEEEEAVSVQEDEDSWTQPTVAEEVEDVTETYQPVVSESDYQFSETPEVADSPSDDTAQFEAAPFEAVESFPVEDTSLNGKAEMPEAEIYEPVESSPAVAAPTKSRFSDRNVDLPIEVGEDERRLHNDARRFARLLVSEIKLYNEQKVKEGREAQDLYERLREAIDRSRDMYDKRVQPPVAAKFDYFHYELVSSLAEGDNAKLGSSYPGATV